MVPDIIESMKDSPDEMNRNRYPVIRSMQQELQACQEQLEHVRVVLGLTGIESRPLALYVRDLITKHNELADQESLDTQRFIAATKAIKEVCPTATSLEHGITLLAELKQRREETVAMCEQLRQELAARPAGTSNSHLYPSDHYGL